MNNYDKEEIHFLDENTFEIIAGILSKGGVEETLEDAAENDDSAILMVFDLIKNLAKGNLSEKAFIDSLQTKLKISFEAAKNILQDVKEKILPRTEKIKISNQEKKTLPDTPVGNDKTDIDKNQNTIEEMDALKLPPTIEKKTRIIRKTTKTSEINKKEELNLPKKPDNYREPI